MPTSTARRGGWRSSSSGRYEHAQPLAERDRAPAGVDRPPLLARALRRVEAAADDDRVVVAAPEGLEEALLGRVLAQEAVEVADVLDLVADPRAERRPDRG